MSVPSQELLNPAESVEAHTEPEAVAGSGADSATPEGTATAAIIDASPITEETTPAMAAPQLGGTAPDGATSSSDSPQNLPDASAAVPHEDPMEAAMRGVGPGGKPLDMYDLDAASEPTEGAVVRGVIVHKDRDGALLVDIGAKSEGLVRPNEVSRGTVEGEEEPKVGDEIRVVVIGRDKEDGKLLLSKKRADFEQAWDKVEEALQDQRVIHAMVTERVKGGLVVDLGIRGFVPASHVGTGDFKHTNLDKYVGQSVALKVIEVDREKRKVILSNKDATREERASKRAETLASLKEGQVRDGIVRRVTDYGAFVDLGGIDGLLHVSEMSWARINHPSDVVKVGDKIQVMILKMRPDQDRISLGLRQILPDPWTEVPGKYNVGDRMQVTVSRVVPFGAFVTLEGGIEAIIPNSELSARRVSKPTDIVNPGDQVEAQIIELKPEERKMTLSLRRIAENERRETDAAAREQEYQEFRALSSGGGAAGGGAEGRSGGREKRRRETTEYNQGGRVTLGDLFGEQLGRARKEASRKGRGGEEGTGDVEGEVEVSGDEEAIDEE